MWCTARYFFWPEGQCLTVISVSFKYKIIQQSTQDPLQPLTLPKRKATLLCPDWFVPTHNVTMTNRTTMYVCHHCTVITLSPAFAKVTVLNKCGTLTKMKTAMKYILLLNEDKELMWGSLSVISIRILYRVLKEKNLMYFGLSNVL